MSTKIHKMDAAVRAGKQQEIVIFAKRKVDFNDASVKAQLNNVKKEIRKVLDGAHVDSSKLSVNFTV